MNLYFIVKIFAGLFISAHAFGIEVENIRLESNGSISVDVSGACGADQVSVESGPCTQAGHSNGCFFTVKSTNTTELCSNDHLATVVVPYEDYEKIREAEKGKTTFIFLGNASRVELELPKKVSTEECYSMKHAVWNQAVLLVNSMIFVNDESFAKIDEFKTLLDSVSCH